MQYVHGDTAEKRRLNAYSHIHCSPAAPRLSSRHLPTLLSLTFRVALHGPKACRLSGCTEAGSSRGATGSQVHYSAALYCAIMHNACQVALHSCRCRYCNTACPLTYKSRGGPLILPHPLTPYYPFRGRARDGVALDQLAGQIKQTSGSIKILEVSCDRGAVE
jgi:hypothetical protein